MAYFDGIKIGDRVWSFDFGWGIVVEINEEFKIPIVVEFDKLEFQDSYNYDGKSMEELNQTLFWDKIEFDIPKNPKIELSQLSPSKGENL